MLIKTFTLAAALTGSTASIASAQTVEQHNGPGGPKQRVERIINLPPPPPAPTGAPAGSTTTVTSPPAAPAKKN